MGNHPGVTSSFTNGLHASPKHHRLDVVLDSVTYPPAVGAKTPDSRVFLNAVGQSGCRPEEAIHIGDPRESGYLGAKAVGLLGVWPDRAVANPPEPDGAIRDLGGSFRRSRRAHVR